MVLSVRGDVMAFKNKAQATAYINDYARKTYDRLSINPTKEEGAAIRAAAAAAGQSNQQYILQAVRERMEREGGEYNE